MNKWVIVSVLFVIIVIGAIVLVVVPGPNTANAPTIGQPALLPDLIKVSSPLPNAIITSPLTVSGQARGTWFFEASAPYILKDAEGTPIAQGHVDTSGDWMTSDFVPFSATITFSPQPTGSVGTLVLMNDNPSGDPANQKELNIPVTF